MTKTDDLLIIQEALNAADEVLNRSYLDLGPAYAALIRLSSSRETMPEMEHEISSRGFKIMPPLQVDYDVQVSVYESSRATEPGIWICFHCKQDEVAAHFNFEQARMLCDQIDWLMKNHYQVRS